MTKKLNTESITFVTDEDTRERIILYTFYQNVSIGSTIRDALKEWFGKRYLSTNSLVSGIVARMNAQWQLKVLSHKEDPSKGMESKAEFLKRWESDLSQKLDPVRVKQILDLYEKNYK